MENKKKLNCENCRLLNSEFCDSCIYGSDPKLLDFYALLQKENPVEHPPHYQTGKFECIDVMIEALGVEAVKGFCLGNAFKYLYRCKHKGKELEDIKKAKWYIDKFIEMEKGTK